MGRERRADPHYPHHHSQAQSRRDHMFHQRLAGEGPSWLPLEFTDASQGMPAAGPLLPGGGQEVPDAREEASRRSRRETRHPPALQEAGGQHTPGGRG